MTVCRENLSLIQKGGSLIFPLMRRGWRVLIFCTWCCHAQEPVAPVPTPAAELPIQEWPDKPAAGQDVTRSKSLQFRISGSDPKLRGTVSFLAEQAKTDFLGLTGEKDEWKIPVTVVLHGKQGDLIPKRTLAMDLQYGEDGFKLIINAHLAQGIEQQRFHSAVLSALVYERSLRTMKSGPLEERLLVRPWLVEGMSEVLAWKRGEGDRRLYQAIFQAGGLYDLEDMLGVSQSDYDNYDSAMRAAFRVSAGGLMMALIEQPSGHEAFRSFLAEAARFGGEMPLLLRKHFPGLNLSKKSLEKWWALQMANQSRFSLSEVMSIAETELMLADALKLRYRNEEGLAVDRDINSWAELAALDEGARLFGVRHAEEALVRLSYRCFPSYRPLLQEYQLVLHEIVKHSKKFDIAAKLNELDESRVLMSQRGKRAADYLDWFEITRARQTSGVFDDYMKLKQRLDQGLMQDDDHISKYLDRAEKLYKR